MSTNPATQTESAPDVSKCLARSVVDALGEEPSLEAVTIDRAHQTISLATLGKTDEPRLAESVSYRIRRAYETGLSEQCQLLQGEGDCRTCDAPLSNQERQKITIQHSGETTTIARVTCPTAPKFWRWRNLPWPRVVQRDVEFLEEAEHIDQHINEWKPQLAAAILCGVFGLIGYFFRNQPWHLAAHWVAYLAGAWFPAVEVWERLRQRAIDVHFLMLAVAAGAAAIGAWAEGTTLLFLFSLSGALEHFALGRTQREIRSLFREAPKFATVLDAGREQEVKVERLRPGQRLLIKPGAQFPVDAEIARGRTAADESNLTGEATPVDKAIGDTVLAGTINLWGAVEAVVLRPATESALQKIIRLIKTAQQQKAPAQRFTDRFSAYYTYLVLGLSFVMFFVWWLGAGLAPFASVGGTHSAFYRAMTLLVVASPCALVLSIPSAVLAAIAWSARHGILFRGGAAVEKLAEVNVVALDKTGTLTTGELRVEHIESFPVGRENEIARLAYSLEKLSTHPLARAITRYGKQQQLAPIELDHFESVTGHGLKAWREGIMVLLGRREWVEENSKASVWSSAFRRTGENSSKPELTRGIGEAPPHPIPLPLGGGEGARRAGEGAPEFHGIAAAADRLKAELQTDAGFSEIWLAQGELVGRIILRDDVRPQARPVVEQLRGEGLRTVVLTGDRKATAEHLRTELQLDDVRAELKPEHKVGEIRQLTEQGRRVAMVGDGVNDAPSLAVAHIGVAMGARGSDAALEQADVVLMHDRLENFLAAFRLSQRARRVIRQNLVISLGTVAVLVTFALLGRIPLTIGVVGHEGSTVVVVMNSLRLLFGGGLRAGLAPAS